MFTKGYVAAQEPGDRTRFVEGSVAIQWNGNWAAPAAAETLGEDLLILPPPDFGNGPVIGAASWQFGISSSCENPEGAAAWIEFALQDEYLTAFSDLIGLVPATATSAANSKLYYSGSQFENFVEISSKYALIRPATPAYPVIAKEFEKALADIRDGKDVKAALDAAVDAIDADLASNNFYN
jgi:multiple sugar transport system substrate-binding protein